MIKHTSSVIFDQEYDKLIIKLLHQESLLKVLSTPKFLQKYFPYISEILLLF